MGKKSLVDEFWEVANFELPGGKFVERFFSEFQEFIDPRTYGGGNILRSLVRFVTDMVK